MADLLKDKVAVVTGAGRGIGRGEALALAAEGAKVVVNDLGGGRNGTGETAQAPADQVVEEIRKAGGSAVVNYDSVATWEGAENIIKTALDNFGRIDILVNNAGILRDRMVFNMTEEEWDIVMKVHLYGHFYCTRFAAPIMRQQRWGRIINTSSQAGLGSMGQANYSAAKEGIVGFTRTVARDLGRYGVTCNAIRPRAGTRLTLTPEIEEAAARARAQGLPTIVDIDELRAMRPEDVGPLVVYLCSEAAANINGRVFLIGGGQISLYPEPEPIKTIYKKEGGWEVAELLKVMPGTLAKDVVNPTPPQG
jgi:hypothetical protein